MRIEKCDVQMGQSRNGLRFLPLLTKTTTRPGLGLCSSGKLFGVSQNEVPGPASTDSGSVLATQARQPCFNMGLDQYPKCVAIKTR